MNKTILIADDDRDLLEILELRCTTKGCTVLTAEDGMTAISTIDVAKPDVICLDIQMPSGTGLSVAEMVLTDGRLGNTPVILMTGSNDPALWQRAADMDVPVVKKGGEFWDRLQPVLEAIIDGENADQPIDNNQDMTDEAMDAFINNTIDNSDAAEIGEDSQGEIFESAPNGYKTPTKNPMPQHRTTYGIATPYVLHIEDDEQMSEALKTRLESCGVAVVRAFNGTEGYQLAMRYPIDLVLLDYELPEGQGDYVLRRLKETPAICDLPVIVLSGRNEGFLRRKMQNLGAAAYLNKPINFEALTDEMSKHINLVRPGLKSVPHWREKSNTRITSTHS